MREILVVEPDRGIFELYVAQLEGAGLARDAELIHAPSVEMAEEALLDGVIKSTPFACVIFAGDLRRKGKVSDAYNLARLFRAAWPRVPMIAASGDPAMNEELLKAGCNEAAGNKSKTIEICFRLIGLAPQEA